MRWPLWLLLLALTFDLSIILAIWASLGDLSVLITTLILAIFTTYLYLASSLTLKLDENKLSVGRANIDIKYLKDAKVLSRQDMLFYRGAGIDPRAYLAIRFWIKGGLKIEIDDPRDPTPYWLISSKQSEEFVAKLNC